MKGAASYVNRCTGSLDGQAAQLIGLSAAGSGDYIQPVPVAV